MHYPAFFHHFSEMFTSDTGTGQMGSSARPYFKEDAGSGFE
jgi:hypothetical protein